MKIWYKIERMDNVQYKEMKINRKQEITKLEKYLHNKNCSDQQRLNQTKINSLLQAQNTKQKVISCPQNQFIKKQSQTQSERNGQQTVQIEDQDGNKFKVQLKNIYPSLNQCQSSKVSKKYQVQNRTILSGNYLQNLLGKQRLRTIPVSQKIQYQEFINAPNVINSMVSKVKHKSKPNQSQRRSNFFQIDSNFCIQLVNRQISSKNVDRFTIKSGKVQRDLKDLSESFSQKLQRLLIDKQLSSVCFYVISSKILSLGSSNDPKHIYNQIPLTRNKYLYSLFNLLQTHNKNYWNYNQLPLMLVLDTYQVFLSECQFKVTFYLNVETQKIKKVELTPFIRLPETAIGRDLQTSLLKRFKRQLTQRKKTFTFRGRIFRILMNSSQQTKSFYKIPALSQYQSDLSQIKSQKSLQDLIEEMSCLGFKMSEISSLIRNFSLILNLDSLYLEQMLHRDKDRSYYHVRIVENDISTNLKSLYAGRIQAIYNILLGQRNQKGYYQQTKQTVSIKKQVMMKILWEQSISKFSNQINFKLEGKFLDLQKSKKFEIFCYSNAIVDQQTLVQQISIEDGSLQQFQYLTLGRRIIQKQVNLELSNTQLEDKDMRQIQNQFTSEKELKSYIQRLHLERIDIRYTSFNQVFLNKTRQYQGVQESMKELYETKQVIKQIFNAFKLQNTTQKYFNQYFATKGQLSVTQNNYIFCSDYHNFVNQQNQGNQVLKFVMKIISQRVDSESIHPNILAEYQKESLGQQESKAAKQEPADSISKESKGRQSQQQYSQSPSKRTPIKHNLKECYSTQHQSLIKSLIKNPKRSAISLNLQSFTRKYLYGQQLKSIHRYFTGKNKNSRSKVFNSGQVCCMLEQNILNLRQIRLKQNQDQSNKQTEHLIAYNLLNDIQSNKVQIRMTQSTLNGFQQQIQLQNKAIIQITRMFRASKFRKNNQNYLVKLINRRKAILKLNKLSTAIKKRQFTGLRVLISLRIMFSLSKKRYIINLKASFKLLKLRFVLSKLQQTLNQVIRKDCSQKVSKAFLNLNNFSRFKKCFDKISSVLLKINCQSMMDSFGNLNQGLYSLVVTSPTGYKKNLQQLSIDVPNANNTSLVQSGKHTTSHIKGNSSQHNMNKDLSKVQHKSLQTQQPISQIRGSDTCQIVLKECKPNQLQITKGQKVDRISQKLKVNQDDIECFSQILVSSVLSGSMVSCKSQTTEQIKREELFQIKDRPFFSFQIWGKDVGAKFPTQQNKPCPILFRKYQQQKIKPFRQPLKQIQQDKLIRQKILSSKFSAYLKDNLNLSTDQTVDNFLFYQKTALKKPVLKHYDVKKSGEGFQQTFNNILKISCFKNSTKRLHQLLNLLLKPIRDACNKQRKINPTVFSDEPLMKTSYESEYNVLRDQMFLQFIKQFLGNSDANSVTRLSHALEVITKSYCPSVKLFYPYLNYIKAAQADRHQHFSNIYENLLIFSQAIQGYKGASVKIYETSSAPISQVQHSLYLQNRQSMFTQLQTDVKQSKLIIKLYNQEQFEFTVRNQCLRTIKKRLLSELGFLNYEKNFGIYEERGASNYNLLDEKQKAIDYLLRAQSTNELMGKSFRLTLYLRVRHYYPIKFKDINSLRMFYLNMISQEIRMPFKEDDYENIIALSINFDQFEQNRITNYLVISNKQSLKENDYVSIKNKLQKQAKSDNQKKVCQFQYFKVMKEFNFLLAKVYRVLKQKPLLMDQIDKIVIKPKQICFYSSTTIKSSVNLYRIKSFYFEKDQISIDLIYSDRDLGQGFDKKFHGIPKSLVIKDFYRIKELYEDIVYYTELLHLGSRV